MYKVAVMTSTRAEYGLLKSILHKIEFDQELELILIVGGTHLSKEWGNTVEEIEADKFSIAAKIKSFPKEDTEKAVVKSMGETMIELSEVLATENPDIFLVLGDRYEIFAAVAAAYTMRIPVAHIAGGEVTAGALDEAYRHSISKMANLHFTANEIYRRRVIQLGENPKSVILAGDTGAENIRKLSLLSREELETDLGIPKNKDYVLATYHPVTLSERDCEREIEELLKACDAFPEMIFLFTMANADSKGKKINQRLQEYVSKNSGRIFLFASLGQIRYLSAMKHCQMVLGNSSSGIIEAPTMGVATVNIGSRQDGRLRADSILDCRPVAEEIITAIQRVCSEEFQSKIKQMVSYYNQVEDTSEIIVREVKKFLKEKKGKFAKKFYDLPMVSKG